MDNLFVTYEQALDLKDLGFKDSCFGEWRQWDGGYPWLKLYQDLDGCSTDDSDYQYTTEALAPLKSQAILFLLSKADDLNGGELSIRFFSDESGTFENYGGSFNTLEEAIDILIKIVKNK